MRKLGAQRRSEAPGVAPAPAPPESSGDLAERRILQLEAPQRRVLLAAALQERPRPATVFSRMLGGGSGQLLARLSAGRFLTMSFAAGRRSYALSRDGDREVLLRLASPGELTELHAAAAEALAADGAPVEEIARHHVAADPSGAGVTWALRAAAALSERGEAERALSFYEAALAAGRSHPQVHRGMAAALRARGDALAALRHLGLARRGASPRELRELRAEAAALCAVLGKVRTAERLCLQTLAGEAEMDPADPASASAYATLCDVKLQRGDLDGATAACRGGLEHEGVSLAVRLELRNTLGKALLSRGDLDAARAAFEANLAEAAEIPRARMLARINLGVVAHRRGERQAAAEHHRAALEISRSDAVQVALARGNLAALHHEAGDFHLAAAEYAAALAACRRSRRTGLIGYFARNSARLAIFLGQTSGALRFAAEAVEAATTLRDPYHLAGAHLVLGEALEIAPDRAAAAAELRRAHEGFAALGNRRYEAESLVALVRVHLAAGDREEAARLVATLDALEITASTPAIAVEAHLAAGEVALASGDLPLAHRRVMLAREVLLATPVGVGGDTDLEAPWRAYHLLARVHQALDHPGEADANRLRAVRLLDELAARVPAEVRGTFLSLAHRAALVRASTDGEIGPERAASARSFPGPSRPHGTLVGTAPSILRLVELLPSLGGGRETLLLRGESGTGKELLARSIHEAGPRAASRFVRLTCAGIPGEHVLADLAGAERRRGKLEQAAGGTLFVEEVADLPPAVQALLVDVITRGTVEHGDDVVPTDVRVIAATCRDLQQLAASGSLRVDLLHLLRGVVLELPPLRERREDVPLLARHFLETAARERGERPRTLSPAALERLICADWPGNVRELEQVVRSAALFARGEVIDLPAFHLHEERLPAATTLPPSARGELDFYALARERNLGLRDLTHEVEMQMVRRALEESRGNIARAAVLLHMKRSRLSQIVNAHQALRMLTKEGAS